MIDQKWFGDLYLSLKRKFRKAVFVLANILCITPWYDFEKGDLKYRKFNKIYAIVHGVIIGIGLTAGRYSTNKFSIVDRPLRHIDNLITLLLFIKITCNIVTIKPSKWRYYLRRLMKWNDERQKSRFQFVNSFHIHFVLGHLMFILSYVYGMHNWLKIVPVQTSLIREIIPEYYYFLQSLILSYLAIIIKFQYEKLTNHLESFCTKQQIFTTDNMFVRKVSHIGRLCRATSELTQVYNDIEGWKIFLIFAHSILRILRAINWMFITHRVRGLRQRTVFSIVLCTLLSLGESAYIILCCESAASAGRKMEQVCHKLQENFDINSKARKELFKLAEIARSYSPKFTAANFFVINKGTILGIINIATTYLIVIIQFNGTLKVNN